MSGAEDDGITRWRRVADAIRVLADAPPGAPGETRLPTEDALAERFGVNRHTVRRAIAALTAEGLLRAERGRGTFATRRPERLPYPVGARTRFSENVTSQSREPGGRLIRAERTLADSRVAAALALKVGAPVHRLETLHVADGVPLSVATSWFEAARFPGIVAAYAETGSITAALAVCGLSDYRRSETRVTAERASPPDADHLGCAPDAVLLVATAIDVDGDGAPVQAMRTRFHGERIELTFRT